MSAATTHETRADPEPDRQHVLDLLAAVGRRDEAAFRQLYALMSRRVYAFALHHLADPADAAEIVGETLYEVWRRPEAFRGESRLSTWVLGIARHKILDRLRQRRGARRHEHDDIDAHLELADPLAPDGFDQVAARERQAAVAGCIARLGEPHRECLHLVYFEELSLGEVAQVQGVPEGTVKTRLFHARAKIKRCLEAWRRREEGAAQAQDGPDDLP